MNVQSRTGAGESSRFSLYSLGEPLPVCSLLSLFT